MSHHAAPRPVTIVGGGLAGLVAAVTAAEAGAPVTLLEAHTTLGGRARSAPPPYVANDGPHVVYADGAAWAWLRERGLHRPSRRPPVAAFAGIRFRLDGELRRLPPAELTRMLRNRRRTAPVDLDFRTWAAATDGERAAALASRAAGVVTYAADPGLLSAAFVWERLLRATNPFGGPRYVGGGWGGLVERLAAHARSLGVHVVTGRRVDELPDPPVVVATSLPAARILLQRLLPTPATSGRTALLDVAVRRRRGDAFAVSDLDESGWVEQFSLADPDLAPRGESLFQAHMPLREGELSDPAHRRAAALLSAAAPGWVERTTWRRRGVAQHRTGALDLPGSTWRDRPAIDQGDGVFLAGDEVAAPGLLSEVAVASGVRAGRAAVRALARGSARRGDPALPTRGTPAAPAV